jgi:hypothetical protein
LINGSKRERDFFKGVFMRLFIVSLVLSILLFEELNAVPIELSTQDVNDVIHATLPVQTAHGERTVMVLDLLMMFYQTNPEVIQLILNIYNSYKPGKIGDIVIQPDILSKVPADIRSIIFTKHGKIFILNPTIFSVLYLLKTSIMNGIDAAKKKTFKAYIHNFFEKMAPSLLLLSVELVWLTLGQIIQAVNAMKALPKKTLCITIPDHVLIFEKF